MKKKNLTLFSLALAVIITASASSRSDFNNDIQEKSDHQWKIHDMNRPLPPVVKPFAASTPGQPPSDAIVLFNGKDISQWCDSKGKPAQWKVEQGYMEVVKKTGSIRTKQNFGDCQLI